MTNLSNDLIKQLKKDTGFQEFQEYIVEQIELLDSLDALDDKADNSHLGEEVRARMEAKRILFAILEPFIRFKEKEEASKEQKEKAKEKYGL